MTFQAHGLLPLLLMLVVSGTAAQSTNGTIPNNPALSASIDLIKHKTSHEQRISELESQHGPFDARLLEPLTGLTEIVRQEGKLEAMERLLNRRQQLLHIAEGPATPSQIPVIIDLLRIDLQRGLLDSVTERFEYLYFIHSENPQTEPDALLNSLNDLRAWHLLAMYLDLPERRIEHAAHSRKIQERLFLLAEKSYGANSERLIPWLYSIASESYRVVNYLESEGILFQGASNHVGREETLELVKRIQAIVDYSGNAEAQAMATILLADFQLLRRESVRSSHSGRLSVSTRGSADRTYRRAIEMLKDSGVDATKISDFFSRPMPLPASRFHLSLDAALEQRVAEAAPANHTEQNEFTRGEPHLGDFLAWTGSLPAARILAAPDLPALVNSDPKIATLRFTVDSVGRVRSPRTIQDVPNTGSVRSDAQDAIKVLQFRPALIDGRWRKVRDITMRFVYPPEGSSS